MTPKEKAIELVSKMYNYFEDDDAIAYSTAKECALIAVDEILLATTKFERRRIKSINTKSGIEEIVVDIKDNFYKEVKQEIEAL